MTNWKDNLHHADFIVMQLEFNHNYFRYVEEIILLE